ncbi:MAG TPA: serine hydrolase domain-containing protein [Polyangiales bacterium]|nr:serine hydrolase domain-containing protein [Polyangiales bacterium]
MLKLIAIAMTALSALGCAPRKPALPDDLSSAEDFERYVDSIVATGDPPGISVAIVRDTGLVYARGFGWADRPRQLRATPETAYQWWSITKVFTATAVLQLAEARKVELDAPVKRYLDFFEPKNAGDYEPATVRQLLSHSACLNDVGMAILGWVHFDPTERRPQLEFAEEKLREHGKIVCEPGSEGRYSNLGYIVLAALIEKVSGQGYEDYVAEHIFEPLGMKNSNFVYTVAMRGNEAAGSHPKNLMSWFAFKFFIDEKLAIRELIAGRYWFRQLYSDQKGSTGAIGPATDLGRFATALLRGGELDGVRILSRESVELMARPVVRISKGGPRRGMQFGLAWFREDDEGRATLSHRGGGMAFRAMLALHPEEKLGVVVLSNSTYLDGDGGARIAKAAAMAN